MPQTIVIELHNVGLFVYCVGCFALAYVGIKATRTVARKFRKCGR